MIEYKKANKLPKVDGKEVNIVKYFNHLMGEKKDTFQGKYVLTEVIDDVYEKVKDQGLTIEDVTRFAKMYAKKHPKKFI